MKKLVVLLIGTVLVTGALFAEAPCSGTYARAKSVIVDARVGRGLETKLLTKVENAWRTYRSGKKNAQKDALHELDVALGLLDRNSTKQLPADLREAVAEGIAAFRGCIEHGEVSTASLTIRVTRPSIDTAGAMDVVAGAIIRVNDVEVATTPDSGQVTVDVPAGETSVEAVVYPMEAASTGVNLLPGTAQTVDLLLNDSEPEEDTDLVVDEAAEGVLPGGFTSFTLRFVDPAGARVALRSIEDIRLRRSNGSGWTYWADAFRVAADGSLQPLNLTTWRGTLAAQAGKLELGVSAIDTRGRVHQGTYVFYLASFTVQGRLVAPPSNPALNVGGIPVFASILNTDVVFRTVSAADGSFSLPPLPRGNLEIDATTVADGKNYYGDAVVTLSGNVRVIVNMLYTTDKINGVPLFRTEPLTLSLPGPAAQSTGGTPLADRGRPGPLGFMVAPAPVATADTNSATVTVSGASRDTAVTRTATLTVPQGTPSIILRYEVRTAEYPYYVLSNSIYNDWWYLEATAATNGARLFRRLRQINSQLTLEPIWQSNGSTGELQYELDTQTLTQYGPADVTVLASTANVGDGALATTVTATLSRNFNVSINFIDKDTVRGFTDRWPHQTHGLSDRFSIPRAGETNYAQRHLTFGVRKPTGSTVTNVKVFVKGANAFSSYLLAPANPIVDESPGNAAVTQDATDPNRFDVRVTFDGTASPFATVPPPAPRLRYLIKVTVDDSGATKTAERETETYYPLWHMPDGFARYGQPPDGQKDWGGDDWCSMFTYQWLDANRALISSINDISGEHAGDTGHQYHYEGHEIDVFHYYTFPGITTYATGNYLALARDVPRMTSADPDVRAAARGRVTAWVTAMRDHLTSLGALYDVERLITTKGGTEFGVADGWGRQLLTTGTCTVGSTAVDLGIGTWDCPKCGYNHVHDNHVHITLTDAFN